MEIKMKEKVNINTFTFKKRVIEETLELIGKKRNYILNDIYFLTMVTFLNNLVENNLILASLGEENKLEENMYKIVEPMFKKEVLDKPERYEIFEDIVMQLEQYLNREIELRRTVAGFLYDFFDGIGELTKEDLTNLVNMVLDRVGSLRPLVQPSDEEIKKEIQTDIDDAKMKLYIEQFRRQTEAENKDAE